MKSADRPRSGLSGYRLESNGFEFFQETAKRFLRKRLSQDSLGSLHKELGSLFKIQINRSPSADFETIS